MKYFKNLSLNIIHIGLTLWIFGLILYLLEIQVISSIIGFIGIIIIFDEISHHKGNYMNIKEIWKHITSDDDRYDNTKYNSMIFFLVFALLISSISFVYDYSVLTNTIIAGLPEFNNMFERSGAVLVLFGVINEYNLNKISVAKAPDNAISYGGMPAMFAKKLPKKHNNIRGTTHIVVIVGTFVWGYGSIVLSFLN